MDIFLQLWAGLFYLLNKIFFSIAEKQHTQLKRTLRMISWSVYLLGVPAWTIILIGKSNWIAASIQLAGVPAMLLGLYNVINHTQKAKQQWDTLVSLLTYLFIIIGLGYSINEYGGIISLSQFLEIGTMTGFLLGGYLLAKDNHYGWPCFMLMNASMGTLMLIQDKPILAIQQGISLCFVMYGFLSVLKNRGSITLKK